MSTNGASSGGAPRLPNGLTNGTNGYATNITNGYHVDDDDDDNPPRVPPTRPPSPDVEADTTPRVLLNERLAEAPSHMELLRSFPTSQPPFFSGSPAYTHPPGLSGDGMNGVPSTSAPITSRYLAVPGHDNRFEVNLGGLELSSCSGKALVPTPFNTPITTPRTSPTTPRRRERPAAASNGVSNPSGTEIPSNTPSSSDSAPPASTTTSPTTPVAAPRRQPAIFGSPLHPTRQNGAGGAKKKRRGKFTDGNAKGKVVGKVNGKVVSGRVSGRVNRKSSAKDKMLGDPTLAVAHEESPIYQENIPAILRHPEAVAVLSSTPGFEAGPIDELISTGALKEATVDFVNDGKSGYNDPIWMEIALEASNLRFAGVFEPVLDAIFAMTWAEDSGSDDSDDSDDSDQEST